MCMRQSLDFPNRIQSPLNYTGGKFRLLPQILPLFPANIDVLVDLFCGGGNVGINTSAERIVLNDSNKNVMRIFRLFRQYPTEQILEIIDGIIGRYGLSDSRTNGYAFYQCESARGLGTYNKEGYNRLRSELNNMKRRNDRYFFMLFIYADPPYLITCATYNENNGWNARLEKQLLTYLDRANDRGIKFALSNVLKNGDKENTILAEWLERNPMYIRHDLNYNYSNSSYHKKDRSKHSTEVLITNFE